MLYAALGDSISYGYDATDDKKAFVRRFAAGMEGRQRVNVFLQAKPGWTSKQLWKAVKDVQPAIWEEARVVTLLVGGNDLLRNAPWLLNGNQNHLLKVADNYYENLTHIVETVKRPHHVFLVGTLYNPFPNSIYASEFTQKLNAAVRRVARRHRLRIVDIANLFEGRERLLIHGYRQGVLKDMKWRGNPIHPNDAGHRVMAQAFLRARQVRRKRG